MPDQKPIPFNVVPDDITGTTWALPNDAIARFGKGKLGDVKNSPDGTCFAVGTGMGLWWYETTSMLPISLWETKRGMINSIAFSHEGNWIVIANSDGILKVIDVQSGALVTQIEDQAASAGLSCSSNGKWIATASSKGVVRVLDIHQGVCIAQMDRGKHEWQSNDISQLEFSPDGKLLAGTAYNSKLYTDDNQVLNPDTEGRQTYIWDPETGTPVAKFAGDTFAFSPDSCLLACATSDDNNVDNVHCCVSVWSLKTRERLAHFIGHSDWIYAVTFSPCGKFIASSDGTLRVWDLTTGAQKIAYADYDAPFYSSEGVLFAVVFRHDPAAIEVWNVEHREKIHTLKLPKSIGYSVFWECPQLAIIYALAHEQASRYTHAFPALCEPNFPWPDPMVVWLNDKTLASRGGSPGIVLWDTVEKRVRERLMKGGEVHAFTVLPCGKLLATALRDATKVWDVNNPDKPIAEFTAPAAPSQWVRHEVFSPTGDYLAAGSREGTVYVWDLQQPEHPILFTGHTGYVWSLAFSPDGKRLVTGSADETARLWDVEAGKEISILPMDKPRIPMGVTFSPCGTLIAGGMNNEVRLWCTEQLTTLRTLPQPEDNHRTYAIAFSPCGKYLASGTWWQKGMVKMAIRLWDVKTGENIHTFWGHTTDVQSLAFSPNGQLLASGSHDSTILLWDLKPYLRNT